MADAQEIDKAIGAHGMWKNRLKQAVDTGRIETPVDTVRMDNQCAFGKWLYGATLTAADKQSAHYGTVKGLHAEFHAAAARVMELATAGKKHEAEKILALDGDFGRISSKLTNAMMAWKKALG
jgi:methyl-accepting chemotaxis protein